MGHSTRSINESQYRMRHSSWGNSHVVLSRWYFCGMEVQWLSLVDLRQTYALPALPRSTSDHCLRSKPDLERASFGTSSLSIYSRLKELTVSSSSTIIKD